MLSFAGKYAVLLHNHISHQLSGSTPLKLLAKANANYLNQLRIHNGVVQYMYLIGNSKMSRIFPNWMINLLDIVLHNLLLRSPWPPPPVMCHQSITWFLINSLKPFIFLALTVSLCMMIFQIISWLLLLLQWLNSNNTIIYHQPPLDAFGWVSVSIL